MVESPLIWFAMLAVSLIQPAEGEPVVSRPAIAATVNGHEIVVSQVQRRVQRVAPQAAPEAVKVLQARTLAQLVEQQLALETLRVRKIAASEQEVDLALSELEQRLKQRGVEWETYLQQTGLAREHIRDELAWKLSWPRMLERYLTDENLQRYFQENRRSFDGTRVQVAHILLKIPKGADPAERQAVFDRAVKLREEITGGTITFDEAARRYSQAATADEGGKLGWIQREAPMPEAFSKAAFELAEDEITEPVESPFGVHLIQCLKIEPGKKSWQEVQPKLRQAIAGYLLHWAAEQQRGQARIEFTGAIPYLRPGTEELVDESSEKE